MADASILCCTAVPHPDAMRALAAHAPQAEIIDVTGDDHAYWREIRARWTGERDLIIIEQDIEIRADTISSLQDCPEPWCCYAYPIFRRKIRLRVGLGCTKISAAAQRAVSARLVAEGFALCAACKGAGCWWHLDGRISSLLKNHAGLAPHVHGDVAHHHDYALAAADHPAGGWPVEWFFEEDTDNSPARAVTTEMPREFAVTPRQARHHASELIRVAQAVAADPSLAVPVTGDNIPYPLAPLPDGLGQHVFLGRTPVRAGQPPVFPQSGAFQTDKVTQGYMSAYYEIADQLGSAARVCEIGVFRGGSLATWRELFPHGTVAGVDVNPDANWPPGTARIVAAQDDPALPDLLSAHEAEWDLIVDDASHDGTLTAATLGLLWPLVSPGGYYVIEDWYVGFPGYRGPCRSPAMLETARSLLDHLTADGDAESAGYRHGLAIMRKRA